MDDLRRPTGILFSLLGVILSMFAVVKRGAQASLPVAATEKMNLWAGLTILIFGGWLLWLSYRRKS